MKIVVDYECTVRIHQEVEGDMCDELRQEEVVRLHDIARRTLLDNLEKEYCNREYDSVEIEPISFKIDFKPDGGND